MKWRTKDGRELDIKKMSTDHLKNTVAMLKRHSPNIDWAVKLSPYLSEAAANASEHAADAIEMELRQLDERMDKAGVEPWHVHLLVLSEWDLVRTYRAMREEIKARSSKCDCIDCTIAGEPAH